MQHISTKKLVAIYLDLVKSPEISVGSRVGDHDGL